jgi:streptogrisin C
MRHLASFCAITILSACIAAPPDQEADGDLTERVAADLGISAEQARARLEAGEQWAALSGDLLDRLGDRYAGAELTFGGDGIPEAFEVYAVDPTDADLANDSGPLPVRLVAVRSSLADLTRAARAIADQVGGLERIAFDFPTNSLIARPDPAVQAAWTSDDIERITVAARAAGTRVSFAPEELEFREQTCNVSVCDPPIRAGTRIWSANGVGCTAAFVAARSGSPANDPVWIMTAGHCVRGAGDSTGWKMIHSSGSQYWIGSGGLHQYVTPAGAGPDWGLIYLNATYTQRANAANWVVAPGNSQHAITSWSGPFAGETVCFSGATSGIHCGTVTRMNGSNLWETKNMPTQAGDSGSPVWDGAAARGILDGWGANSSAYFTGIERVWQNSGGSSGGAHPMTQ